MRETKSTEIESMSVNGVAVELKEGRWLSSWHHEPGGF
jgi:hypothetical protein